MSSVPQAGGQWGKVRGWLQVAFLVRKEPVKWTKIRSSAGDEGGTREYAKVMVKLSEEMCVNIYYWKLYQVFQFLGIMSTYSS